VTRPAPCNAFCPAGNDVVGFVQALARDDVDGAAALLGRTSAFASVCGRVCPAPCMEGCNRAELDGAVDIRALERFIGDHAAPVVPERATPDRVRRVAIVGGGPAGLAAAHTLALAGHEATIFEGEEALGGVLRTGIPSYRLPRDVLDREVESVLALGVKARCGERLGADTLRTLSHDFDAMILATGLARLRVLDVPGTDLEGVEQGIRYLHRVNLEGGGALQGHVVVLGGGNTAMDCARSALRSGASKVTVVYRRTRLEMPAIGEEIAEAEEEGVELLFLRQPVTFHGADRVLEVELAEVELGEPDQDGRRRPLVTDKTARLACDAVLLALGQSPDLSLLPAGWKLLDGRFVEGGEPLNVFAAGDVSTGEGTVTHALGDGRRAAGRALAALGEKVEVFVRPDRAAAVGAAEIRLDHFPRVAPTPRRHQPAASRAQNFDEVGLALEGTEEAKRCFSCGHCNQCDTCLVYCPEGIIARQRPRPDSRGESRSYAVDLAYCKGCGICVTECPRSGMEMVPTCPTN
jgi:NADPH-dependent glutamate synthase beta subunit-like oxidoreductase/Pyruvate/2-oxoacid:ferredoxin oxidoreductase delta subunit